MFQFNGQEFGPKHPFIGTGAGINKHFELGTIQGNLAHADGVVTGATTPDARPSNGGKCEGYSHLGGINSWGMPGEGVDAVPDPDSDEAWNEIRNQIITNIAGFSPMEYDQLFRKLAGRFGAVELNFGCPNVRIGGEQKKIVSFDPENMARILDLIGVFEADASVWVKLSPYSDPGMLAEIAAVINAARRPRLGHIVSVVVTGNSFANCIGYIDGDPMVNTEAAGVYGGGTGEMLKYVSLGQAAKFRELLHPEIGVLRCGGVSSGMDIWETTEKAECDGVQVVTHILRKGPAALGVMRKEYEALVAA